MEQGWSCLLCGYIGGQTGSQLLKAAAVLTAVSVPRVKRSREEMGGQPRLWGQAHGHTTQPAFSKRKPSAQVWAQRQPGHLPGLLPPEDLTAK